jgi:hypothetical protein
MKVRQIMLVLLAVTIGAVLFIPFSSAIASNTGTQSVAGENVTADIGNYTDLNGYDVDSTTVTVDNSTGATVDSADFTVNETDGSLLIESSVTNVNDGETLNVSYDYQATDGQTTTVATLLPLLLALLLLVTLAGRIMTKL